MKAKRKGSRYMWPGKFNSFLPFDRERRVDMLHDEVVRRLNAGERAKAEVKRLKAELEDEQQLRAQWEQAYKTWRGLAERFREQRDYLAERSPAVKP